MEVLEGIIVKNWNGSCSGKVDVSIKQNDASNGSDGTVATVMGSTAFALSGNVGVSSVPPVGAQVYVLKDDKGQHFVIGTVPGEFNTPSEYSDQLEKAKDEGKVNFVGTPYTPQVHPEMTGDEDAYIDTQIIRTRKGHTIRFCDVDGREELDVIHSSGSYIKFMPDGTIKIYAKKNLEVDVGKDLITYVLGNQYTEVRKDRTEVVKKNEDLTVEQNRDRHVKNRETVEVGGSYERHVSNTIWSESGGTTTLKESELQVRTNMSRFEGAINAKNNIQSDADVKSSGGAKTLNNHTHTGVHGETSTGHG